jgi:hypothetical protein
MRYFNEVRKLALTPVTKCVYSTLKNRIQRFWYDETETGKESNLKIEAASQFNLFVVNRLLLIYKLRMAFLHSGT